MAARPLRRGGHRLAAEADGDEDDGSCSDEDDDACSCSDVRPTIDDASPDGNHLGGAFSLDVFSREFSSSPVYKAIIGCSLPALFHAIYCLGESTTEVDANFGVNFLHLTVSTATQQTEAAFEPFVYALSNFWTDPNQEDGGGDVPLRRALRRGLPRLVRALLRCGARQNPTADAAAMAEGAGTGGPVGAELRSVYDQFSPGLWPAVAAGDYFLVDRLLASWCRVRVSQDGESLIGFARRVGASSLVVELLEGSRATLEFAHAALAGDARKMEQLLANRNVNADVRDRGYRPSPTAQCQPRSLRDTAIAMGHRQRVLRLLPEPRRAGKAARPAASCVTRPASAVCAVM